MTQTLRSLTPIVVLTCAAHAAAQTTWHVSAVAPPGGDGLSWATAYDELDDALLASALNDAIWVARGTYLPTVELVPGDPRSVTFAVPPGVQVFGGFDGTETSLAGRAGLFDQTILSGDLGVPGVISDNAYHVLYVNFASGIPPGTVRLDGFTITGGNANGSGLASQGGGVLCFNMGLTLAHCAITGNAAKRGGALHAQPGAVRMKWCSVTDNRAEIGGAIWVHAINLKVAHSVFARNTASARGGAVYINSIGSPLTGFPPRVLFQSCLFHDNYAGFGGAAHLGGTDFASGKGTFANCTFAYNRALNHGGGINAVTTSDIPAETEAYNCIFWENSAPNGPQIRGRVQVQYSTVMGGYAGTGNVARDPLFVNGPARDLRLSPGSPGIDAGDVERVFADVTDVDDDGTTNEALPLDLDGERRFEDDPATPDTGSGSPPVVDMGPYEL